MGTASDSSVVEIISTLFSFYSKTVLSVVTVDSSNSPIVFCVKGQPFVTGSPATVSGPD